MKQYYIVFSNKLNGEYAGIIDGYKTKKDAIEGAKVNANEDLNYVIKMDEYNPLYEI